MSENTQTEPSRTEQMMRKVREGLGRMEDKGWTVKSPRNIEKAKEPWGDVRIMGVEITDDDRVKVTMVGENAHSTERSTQAYAIRGKAELGEANEGHTLDKPWLDALLLAGNVTEKVPERREGEDPQALREREDRAVKSAVHKLVGRKVAAQSLEISDELGRSHRVVGNTFWAGWTGGEASLKQGIPLWKKEGAKQPEKYVKEAVQVQSVRKLDTGYIEIQGPTWTQRFGSGEGSEVKADGVTYWSPKTLANLLRGCPGAQGKGNGEARDVAAELEHGTIEPAGMRWLENALQGVQLERVVKIPKEGVAWIEGTEWQASPAKEIPEPRFTAHNAGTQWVEIASEDRVQKVAQKAVMAETQAATRGGEEPNLPVLGARYPASTRDDMVVEGPSIIGPSR